jgi:hypothetical protein
MKIKLFAGDNEWSTEGTHVCDSLGIAKILEQEIELDVDDAIADKIIPIIEYARVARGLMPDGSLPPPPPLPSEVVVEPPVPPRLPTNEIIEPVIAPLMQAAKAKKKKEV